MFVPDVAAWRSASACQGGGCLEVAPVGAVALRATGDPQRTIIVSASEFRAFVDGAKKGEFDDLARTE